MPADDHYVIIGNGPAGNLAADTLREHDRDARITIISGEPWSYYYKHKLIDYIKGTACDEDLAARKPCVYKEKNIRLRLGQVVERMDPLQNRLYLRHMEVMGYTKLIVACGASPRILPAVSGFGKYLNLLSTCSDAHDHLDLIRKNRRFLVLGGDPISFKFVRMLKDMGKEVTFMLYADAFWPFTLTADMVESVEKSMISRGVKILAGQGLKTVGPAGEGVEFLTDGGVSDTVDSIFAFLGMVPNIGFVLGSGIDTDRGILVDEHLKTNFDNVYAAGDCAQIYNPDIRSYWLSIGWKNASIQGALAAHNLLGEHRVINPSPKNLLEVEGFTVDTSWWATLD